MAKIRVGSTYDVRGATFKVVDYLSCSEVFVSVLGHEEGVFKVRAQALRSGTVRNPYEKKHFNVGYFGEGKYFTGSGSKYNRVYQVWRGMLQRCYSSEASEYYKDCTVHPDWHNFQVFAEWYMAQVGCELGYELDKDILFQGNRIYSSDTCCLVPQEINKLFVVYKNKKSGLPLGVFKNREKYSSSIRTGEGLVFLGGFDSIDEAEEAYKNAKNEHIKAMAKFYKGSISLRAYNAIISRAI